MTIRNLDRLLEPASVAVIGASDRPGSVGATVWRNLRAGAFSGPVYPVNPGARHVRGVPAYDDIESIPDDVDLAVLAVPADEVAGVVEACRRLEPGRPTAEVVAGLLDDHPDADGVLREAQAITDESIAFTLERDLVPGQRPHGSCRI